MPTEFQSLDSKRTSTRSLTADDIERKFPSKCYWCRRDAKFRWKCFNGITKLQKKLFRYLLAVKRKKKRKNSLWSRNFDGAEQKVKKPITVCLVFDGMIGCDMRREHSFCSFFITSFMCVCASEHWTRGVNNPAR